MMGGKMERWRETERRFKIGRDQRQRVTLAKVPSLERPWAETEDEDTRFSGSENFQPTK